jgi:antitoxin component YwqK of YwqJK toxin-antitoxin module
MTENITPEFLAKMHAALRGAKHNVDSKHPHKKKPFLANSSIGGSLVSSPASSAAPAAKSVDMPLAGSVAQTTAEAAVDMADSKVEASKPQEKKEEGGEGFGEKVMEDVLENKIEQAENSLLDPFLAKEPPPPIENGIFEIKDTKDQIIQRTPYKNGKIHGEVQLFDAEGHKAQTYQCVGGVKQGPMHFFDASGALTHDVPYAKDHREGMATFYVNGAKAAEITFHEDRMEGPAIYYASEGYVSTAALYHDNALQGEMRCFDSQQRLVKTMCYLKGQLNGESVTYYPGGAKVFERMNYLQNVPTGKQIQFYEDGTVLSFREYDKGKLVKEKFYDTKGKEVPKKQGGKITNLFPNIPGWKN